MRQDIGRKELAYNYEPQFYNDVPNLIKCKKGDIFQIIINYLSCLFVYYSVLRVFLTKKSLFSLYFPDFYVDV